MTAAAKRIEAEAAARRRAMALDVAEMRKLGVARWGDLVLGPEPVDAKEEPTPAQAASRIIRELERRHEILFAASPVKPKFVPPPHLVGLTRNLPNVEPRASGARGARNGTSG